MDKKGMEFLDKIFKDLYKEKSVSRYKSNKYQNIDEYMKKLTRISNGNHKKLLIKILLDNYVIKEENIPNDKDKINIISSQRNRLEEWITYLTDVGSYPMWIKYWIFRSLIKIGTYSEIDGTYQVRSKKTLAPFIELNAEALAHTVEAVTSSMKGANLNDEEIDKLVKSGSFKKIYTYYLEKLSKKLKTYGNEGTWVKYNQGTDDYIKLSESLNGYNTGWCTASIDMAKQQICGPYDDAPNGGDFYVYYSIDENGLYKIPRIAIRMIENNRIGEIRGTDEGQNLEIGLEDILKSKLDEMSFLSKEAKESSLQKINNSKHISSIISKNLNGETLSIDDIRVIYNLKKCETFGWGNEPRFKKIRKSRNQQTDFNRLDKDDKVKILSNNGDFYDSDLKILCDDVEILLEAFKYNKSVFSYADASKIEDYETLALEAIKKSAVVFSSVEKSSVKDYNTFAMKAVKQNGLVLRHIDKSLVKNYEALALEAVKQKGLAIRGVDANLIKDYNALAEEAVKQDGEALRVVDISKIKDYDTLAMIAIKQDPDILEYIDKKLIKNYDKLVRCAKHKQRIEAIVTFISDKFKELCVNFSLIKYNSISKLTNVTISSTNTKRR